MLLHFIILYLFMLGAKCLMNECLDLRLILFFHFQLLKQYQQSQLQVHLKLRSKCKIEIKGITFKAISVILEFIIKTPFQFSFYTKPKIISLYFYFPKMRNHNILTFVLACFMIKVWSLNLEIIQDINVSGMCKNLLPYSISSVSERQYLTWYGKVGDSITGTTYLAGHLFERHVAVNQKCTTQQITEGKTVFISHAQMVRTVNMDNTNCNLGSTTQFNFRQTRTLATPTEFIDGIDCKTNVRQKFNTYFVEFKRTLQNSKPSQTEYMGSQKVTVWTIYPSR